MTKKKGAASVKFGTPPPRRESPYKWDDIAAELRASPGEWGLVFTQGAAHLAGMIRNRDLKALHPDRGFRIRTANNTRTHPRLCDLWACYEPTLDKESDPES